ncbi:MAG: hypothetical protein MjAS7_2189 [Metallosphaera javensis (ex Sakai et al. 2022)]|nr:MAG: hypothetical protein MjAS7_2189 [Metallosphaera javensis (ex Sakai et al. 2022)]
MRDIKALSKSFETMRYLMGLVLWERKLIPEFIPIMTIL